MRPRGTAAVPDLDLARAVAVDAAEAAGALLRGGARRDVEVRVKDSTGDVVTELDLASEQLIIARIREAFPSHRIIAEESGVLDAYGPAAPGDGAAGGSGGRDAGAGRDGGAGHGGNTGDGADGDFTWLVDPLDGTNNVAIRLPAYVVGIALCAEGLPVLGVVHDPVAGQTWSALRSRGAFGPAGRVPLPECRPAPCGPVLAWTQGHAVARDDATARALRLVLESTARRVLQLWAPLLSWIMLARGDIDGIVGYSAEMVDLPAGALIAAEAGIEIRGLEGQPFDEHIGASAADRSFVAGHPQNIGRLVGLVSAATRLTPQVATLDAPVAW